MNALMGKVLFKIFLFSDIIVHTLISCSFSRRVLWLEVGTTNNDPKVIAGYYLECVRRLKGTFNDYYNYYDDGINIFCS